MYVKIKGRILGMVQSKDAAERTDKKEEAEPGILPQREKARTADECRVSYSTLA
jgi:hypothetical protein